MAGRQVALQRRQPGAAAGRQNPGSRQCTGSSSAGSDPERQVIRACAGRQWWRQAGAAGRQAAGAAGKRRQAGATQCAACSPGRQRTRQAVRQVVAGNPCVHPGRYRHCNPSRQVAGRHRGVWKVRSPPTGSEIQGPGPQVVQVAGI